MSSASIKEKEKRNGRTFDTGVVVADGEDGAGKKIRLQPLFRTVCCESSGNQQLSGPPGTGVLPATNQLTDG